MLLLPGHELCMHVTELLGIAQIACMQSSTASKTEHLHICIKLHCGCYQTNKVQHRQGSSLISRKQHMFYHQFDEDKQQGPAQDNSTPWPPAPRSLSNVTGSALLPWRLLNPFPPLRRAPVKGSALLRRTLPGHAGCTGQAVDCQLMMR